MDMRDASNMTEGSGLTGDEALAGDQARIRHAADDIRGMARNHRAPPLAPRWPTGPRLPDRLRELAREAPLASLMTAFLLGVFVARRL